MILIRVFMLGFLFFLNNLRCDSYLIQRPRVFTRIPQYYVYDKVEFFLKQNGINNCFEYRESETQLLLKCLKNNRLVDVNIELLNNKEQKNFFSLAI